MEFDAPVGYKEPQREPKPEDDMDVDQAQAEHYDENSFYTFKGEGKRLDGKKIKDTSVSEPTPSAIKKFIRGIPDYDHDIFEIKFDRSTRVKSTTKSDGKDQDEFKAFQGEGKSLRPQKKQ